MRLARTAHRPRSRSNPHESRRPADHDKGPSRTHPAARRFNSRSHQNPANTLIPPTDEPQQPTPTQTPADAQTQPPAGQSPSGQATPATRAEPTHTPQTGGICDRMPAVQDAILAALGQSACSAVTDADLATVTSLALKTESVSAADVAGLTAISDIELELTDGLDAHLASLTTLRNAHITFHLRQTPIPPYPVPEHMVTPYNIPGDFLPHQHQDEYGQWIHSTPPPTRFDNLRFTILPGWYPGYSVNVLRRDRTEGPGGRLSSHPPTLVHHLVGSNWAATNVHITERSWDNFFPSLTIPQMSFENITHLNIEVEYIAHEGPSPFEGSYHEGDIDDLRRNSLTSLKIVNLTPDIPLYIPENYISLHPGTDTGIPILTVEIRGLLGIHPEAFHYAFLKELHLDPEPDGYEHRLTLSDWMNHFGPPEGTGWCARPCE